MTANEISRWIPLTMLQVDTFILTQDASEVYVPSEVYIPLEFPNGDVLYARLPISWQVPDYDFSDTKLTSYVRKYVFNYCERPPKLEIYLTSALIAHVHHTGAGPTLLSNRKKPIIFAVRKDNLSAYTSYIPVTLFSTPEYDDKRAGGGKKNYYSLNVVPTLEHCNAYRDTFVITASDLSVELGDVV